MNESGSGAGEMLGLQAVPLNDINAYMIVARECMQSIDVLRAHENSSTRGCCILAGHVLECALKAYLCSRDKNKYCRDPDVRHNLIELWSLAYEERTLNIPEPPPGWVAILSVGHGPNFYFRYMEGENKKEGENKNLVDGGQTPALAALVDGLKIIVKKIDVVVTHGGSRRYKRTSLLL